LERVNSLPFANYRNPKLSHRARIDALQIWTQ
jgi:hypothetical protein